MALHCMLLGSFAQNSRPQVLDAPGTVLVTLTEKGAPQGSAPDGAEKEIPEKKSAAKKLPVKINEDKKPAKAPRPEKKVARDIKIAQAAEVRAETSPQKEAAKEEYAAPPGEEPAELAETETGKEKGKEENAAQSMEASAAKAGADALGASGGAAVPARAHRVPKPKYPRAARMKRQEGTVVFEITVTEKGEPSQIKIVSSSGYERLDKEALAAVSAGSFIPAEKNGRAIASVMALKIRFSLED